jgi:hypothetical protein
VKRTESAICEVRAAGMAAWSLWSVWHLSLPRFPCSGNDVCFCIWAFPV